MEINQCVGCTRQFFTKSFLDENATALAPASARSLKPLSEAARLARQLAKRRACCRSSYGVLRMRFTTLAERCLQRFEASAPSPS